MWRLKTLFFILLTIVLSYRTIAPLVSAGFFPMHDDIQPARVFVMAKALKYGQFPVRWVDDLGFGYGYPLFNFYAPFPYYLGAGFNLLGFSAISSTKFVMGIAMLLAGISMYLFVKDLAGDLVGTVSAVLYVYAPYHAINLYIRGALGELYAYAFLPLLLWGIYKILTGVKKKEDKAEVKKGIIIASISWALILLSHNILGMITGYFLISFVFACSVYLLIKRSNLSFIFYILSFILLGIGLSSFFTLPALIEKKYTKVEELIQKGSDYRNHFVFLDQLWDSPWGYAGSAPGRVDGMSFKIGKFHLILGLVSIPVLYAFYKRKKISKPKFLILNSLFIILVFSIFLMLSQSQFIWQLLPGSAYIQFPWRFLNFVLLALSILTAVMFVSLGRKRQTLLAVAIIVATIFINKKYFTPQRHLLVYDEDYISEESLRFKISKISDEYMPKEFNKPELPEETARKVLPETASVVAYDTYLSPTAKEFNIKVQSPSKLITNIAFFPGWKVYLNNRQLALTNDQGRLSFDIPSGDHNLKILFSDTLVRKLANSISIFSLFLLVLVSLIKSQSSKLKYQS